MCKHFRDVQPNAGEGFEDKVAAVKAAVKKEIDWTKPVRWKRCSTFDTQSIYVEYMGARQIAISDESDNVFLIDKLSGKCCDIGLTDKEVENIPEPKKETWVNIYWHDELGGTRGARTFATKDMARRFIARRSMLRYIVTAQIE